MTTENPELEAFQYLLALESRRRPELYGTYLHATQRELERAGLGSDQALA